MCGRVSASYSMGGISSTNVGRAVSSSRTELDSHANMIVVGRNAFVVNETGKTVDVHAFSPDHPALTLKLIDAVVKYDCPYKGSSQLLLMRNALHVPSMENNLIPPFIMREAGVQVSDTPKIHVREPTLDDHALYFRQDDFRIPFKLHGVFSCFDTSLPTLDEVNTIEDVYMLTPER